MSSTQYDQCDIDVAQINFIIFVYNTGTLVGQKEVILQIIFLIVLLYFLLI
jgi:hypothetical protein